MLPGYGDYSYLRRLNILGEESLVVRGIKCDLLLVYKIKWLYIHGHGLDHLIVFDENRRTRGHSKKLKILPFRVNARQKNSQFELQVCGTA